MTDAPKKKPQGFASLSPERRKEVAASGGAAVPSHKRSFAQSPSLAASAGAKGGAISKRRPKTIAQEPSE